MARRRQLRPSFEGSRDRYLQMVRAVGENFTRPDDDWAPVLFIESTRGVDIAAISPDYLATAESKERLALEVIPSFVSQRGGYRVGLVVSSWMTTYEVGLDLRLQLPAAIAEPGRHEVVTVQI